MSLRCEAENRTILIGSRKILADFLGFWHAYYNIYGTTDVYMYVGEQPSPSIGDIHLVSEDPSAFRRVQVYLPARGGNGLQLGEICLEGLHDPANVGTVICRQYGYKRGLLSSGQV